MACLRSSFCLRRLLDAAVAQALQRYYQEYVPAGAMAYVNDIDAGHAMVIRETVPRCARVKAMLDRLAQPR
jgi:hypothetical protein